MVDESKNYPPKRQYPKFFEKTVPIAIGILVVVITGVLVFAIGVIFGLFNGI
ncbi:MAG: hypothetical protein ABUK20_12090 [Anaerolineales bacterium]|jgi:hypothetical protein